MLKIRILLVLLWFCGLTHTTFARSHLDSLHTILKKTTNDKEQIALKLAICAVHKSSYNGDSLVYYSENILESSNITRYEAGVANRYLGTGYYFLGDYMKAMLMYERSIAIFNEINDQRELQVSLNNLGIMYEIFGKLDSALLTYKKAIIIAEALQDHDGLGDLYNNIAIVHNLKGQKTAAFSSYRKSLKYEKLSGDSIGVADTYANLGAIYYALSMSDKTIDYMIRAGNIYSYLGDTIKLAMIYANLATNYIALKQYNLAEENFLKAAQIQDQLPDSDTKLAMLIGQSNLYLEAGDTAKLKSVLFQSMSMAEKLQAQQSLGMVLASLGKYYLEFRNNPDSALHFYEESYKVRKRIHDFRGQATSLLCLADIEIDQQKMSKAKQKLTEAEEIADSLNSNYIYSELWKNWADYYYLNGDYANAYLGISRHKSYSDSILNESNMAYISRTEGKFQLQIEVDEQERAEKERLERLQAEINYQQSLQFRLIGLFGSIMFLIILSLKFLTLNTKTLNMIIFIFSLLLFEFLLVFLDQYINEITDNSVVFTLVLNVLLALFIIPIHTFLNRFLRNFLIQNSAKMSVSHESTLEN